MFIIELIRDLVPINTLYKFGLDCVVNVFSIALMRKTLRDSRTNCHDISLWPVGGGAKNYSFDIR